MDNNSSNKIDKNSIRIVLVVGACVALLTAGIIAAAMIQQGNTSRKKTQEVPEEPEDPDYPDDPMPWRRRGCDDDPSCAREDKPMIYLYPERDEEVTVSLGYPDKIVTSYPKYEGSWRVFAKTDGSLTDLRTGRELYGLYWEGANFPARQNNIGFVVKGEDSAKFLEEKLAVLGLNEREADEFIVYWLPKLEANKYNYIRFDTNEMIDDYMPLIVSPKPDSVIRIVMSFKGLENAISVVEQKLSTPTREGFVVVEWGGSEIK